MSNFLDDMRPRDELIDELCDGIVDYTEDKDIEPLRVAYKIEEYRDDMETVSEDVFKQLVAHRILSNVDKAYDTGFDVLKAGDIIIGCDYSELWASVSEDAYERIKSSDRYE